MKNAVNTIEDLLEILAGLKGEANIKVESSDQNLLYSMARQVFRGTGFTDRQYELTKEKILKYKDQFVNLDYDIDLTIDNLRIPLRQIDRSRWIKLVDSQGPNRVFESTKAPFIAVRFIFQKKLINNIEAVKRSLGEGDYDKENKIHYFPFSERAVYEIISNFNKTNNFEIQEELKEYYEKLKYMANNKEKFIPGIYGLKLKNLHQKGLEYALSTIGEPDLNNLYHYYDQKEKYGISHVDEEDLEKSIKSLLPLSKKIIKRKKSQVLVNNKTYTKENLAEVILELYRFPLLIVLDQNQCYDQLIQYHKAFNGIIPNESCSVLFRLDNNDEGIEFNQYIKRNNLNNLVDNNTKIVYISNNKLPKPLLKSNWQPSCALLNYCGKTYGSSKTEHYLTQLDLVIHYDETVSQWMKRNIEEL